MQQIKKWIKRIRALFGKKKYIKYGVIAIICIAFFGMALSKTTITSGNVLQLNSQKIQKTQETEQTVTKNSKQTNQKTEDISSTTEKNQSSKTPEVIDRDKTSAQTNTSEAIANETVPIESEDASKDVVVDTDEQTSKIPSPTVDEEQQITVTIEIRCESISGNGLLTANGHPEVEEYAQNPLILQETLTVTSKATVYDVLLLAAKNAGIAVDSTYSAQYQTAYINGINYIYQKIASPRSGWMYQVNQMTENYGCSQYVLKDGDKILWYYTV